MDYQERIELKVGAIFTVVGQYLSNQLSLEQSKDQINNEMFNIRPAQFEAVKLEFGKRIGEIDNKLEAKKLYELFCNYLPFPYKELEEGHPIRNYYQENNIVRQYLVKIDKMEWEDVTLNVWKDIYTLLDKYQIHIKRQNKNFYPFLLSKGLYRQVKKAKELGKFISSEIIKNRDLLEDKSVFDFLLNQRNLTLNFMNYLDLEERIIFPNALKIMTKYELLELRRLDDREGYVYIEKPTNFIPRENNNIFTIQDHYFSGLLLQALLMAKNMSMIYYNLLGEVVYMVGEQLEEEDLKISEKIKQALLTGRKKKKKIWCKQGEGYSLITYNLVRDKHNIVQGILKTKEYIGDIREIIGEHMENHGHKDATIISEDSAKKDINLDANQNVAELFDMYPEFREDFFYLYEDLKDLKGPTGMELLKKSTVEMLARSLQVDTVEFINRINQLLESY